MNTSRACNVEDILGVATVREYLTRARPNTEAAFYTQLEADIRRLLVDLEGIRHQLSENGREGEDKLRTRIVHGLRLLGHAASAETDENGHVDILVDVPMFTKKWVAECKLHSQYEKHEKGLLQLHTRYHSGRCPRSAFIIFCYTRDSSDILSKWRDYIAQRNLCALVGAPTEMDNFEFTSLHKNAASGANVETRHFIATLFYDPQDAKKSGISGSTRKRTSKKAAHKSGKKTSDTKSRKKKS